MNGQMKQVNPIFLLVGKFLLIFTVVAVGLYYAGFNKAYTYILGNSVKAVYDDKKYGKSGLTDVLLPGEDNNKTDELRIFLLDTEEIARIKQARAAGQQTGAFRPQLIQVNIWDHAGLFLVFFIALVIASATNWKRALITLGIGLLILHVFFVWKTGLRVYFEFYHQGIGGVEPGSFWKGITGFLHNFFKLLNANLFIVIILWLLLAFRIDDFQKFAQKLFPSE